MFQNERDYEPAINALVGPLTNLPGKLIAIGGLPGVGKTSLGRYLAYRFNVSLIETDLFLVRGRGLLDYREDSINDVLGSRLDNSDLSSRRPVIIEGASILRLLEGLGRKPDFLIHLTDDGDAPSGDALADDLRRYEQSYSPASTADLTIHFKKLW